MEAQRPAPQGGYLGLTYHPAENLWWERLGVEWPDEGEQTLTVRAADRAGNTGLATTTLTVDNTAPTGTLLIEGGAEYVNRLTVTLALSNYSPQGRFCQSQ